MALRRRLQAIGRSVGLLCGCLILVSQACIVAMVAYVLIGVLVPNPPVESLAREFCGKKESLDCLYDLAAVDQPPYVDRHAYRQFFWSAISPKRYSATTMQDGTTTPLGADRLSEYRALLRKAGAQEMGYMPGDRAAVGIRMFPLSTLRQDQYPMGYVAFPHGVPEWWQTEFGMALVDSIDAMTSCSSSCYCAVDDTWYIYVDRGTE